MRIPIFGYSTLAAMAAAAAIAAEPIRWFNGGWDDTGAPQGKLLTDNSGWWGERVWTGVDCGYEARPDDAGDYVSATNDIVKRKLLDGSVGGNWNVSVGMKNRKPIVAVFDFRRPCTFSEVVVKISAFETTTEREK